MDHSCYLLFVVIKLYCLLIAVLWSPAEIRADLLARLYLKFSCVLSLSNVVSWVRCGA